MNEKRSGDGNFEQRLLEELKTVVARQGAEQEDGATGSVPSPRRRRGPRLAAGAAAVLAATGALLVFNSGGDGTPRAFAVEPQDGGGVTIKVYSAEDGPGLEAALAAAGIRSEVSWLPAGMACDEREFTPSTVRTALGGRIGGINVGGPAPAITIGVMSGERYRQLWRDYRQGAIGADEFHGATGNFILDPAEFRPDQTVVITGAPGPYGGDPEGGFEAAIAIAAGPVPPCEPVPAPAGGVLDSLNRATSP